MRITYLLGFGFILLLFSCTKSPDAPPPTPTPPFTPLPPSPNTPLPANFTVDGKWECDVDGKHFAGTVDTSFTWISDPSGSSPDTVVECTGTANDKRANIHFQLFIKRKSAQPFLVSSRFNGLLIFDTLTTKYMIGETREEVIYTVDSFSSAKLKATFTGNLWYPTNNANGGRTTFSITNGKFSCEFGKGTSEPKTFTFKSDGKPVSGYFCSATLVSNSLILEGAPYILNGSQRIKLTIRTGGTIKPGTYTSTPGIVGFHHFTPSIYPVYVNDSLGNFSVTITSVNGNVVEGYFSGADEYGPKITGGTFRCRVKDYTPQIDSTNKWGFCSDDNYFLYNSYGGNVLNAARSQVGSKHFLTVNGESDHGSSRFKIILSSNSPITKGVYRSDVISPRLDSMVFASNTRIWNGSTTYMYANDRRTTYCLIDSIDSRHVYGTLIGAVNVRTGQLSAIGTEMRKGSFRASF